MESKHLILNKEEPQETGYVLNIPVENFWLLMLYALRFKYFGNDKFDVEKNPEDIPDLIADILCYQVQLRIRRNLSYDYVLREKVLDRVRGRIDLLRTERNKLLSKGKIACRYDELTTDTMKNQYVRDALVVVTKYFKNKNSELHKKCRSLANKLRGMGVKSELPNNFNILLNRAGLHNREDIPMLQSAYLALNLVLPTEHFGNENLPFPYKGKYWAYKIFEEGIRGFYEMNAHSKGWKVRNKKQLIWPKERSTSQIKDIFPDMKTDIILEKVNSSKQIVLDTKFKSITKDNEYRNSGKSLRSEDIYQIYAYLRSQEGKMGELLDNATGLLLYPAIDNEIYETVCIQNHEVRFATIDLSANSSVSIRDQLLSFLY